ncbi:MAG: 4-hydroxythreonine-4-phosphate dehydrogenase PdxA [Terrimicrobiaceae bacterium]|nr:4-hydroxythreonine-4-phosphate dehydrogenase PdxA [Terrimicrobiaceae bacterium]
MSLKTLGVTLGDPAGIGPEVVSAALEVWTPPHGLAIEVAGSAEGHRPGEPTDASARAALEAMETAAAKLRSGAWAGVVTGPVSKNQLHRIGYAFPGQTEFFAAAAGIDDFAMCLTGRGLTVGLVTVHVPYSGVPTLLSEAEIVRVGRLLIDFLRRRGVPSPRVAVCGLNPHAGENGDLGREEIEIIAPAVRALGDGFFGPEPPDTVFFRAVRGEFDGVLCMYHDQGLIPLKLHAFDAGVNVTLGLPFVRTSPDHGTAFGIAGKGQARPDSVLAALDLAAELIRI